MAAVEMQSSKGGIASVDSLSESKVNDYGGEVNVARAYEPAHTTDTTSMRRLFSFVQLLAFALTFMESWEVMAMSMYPIHNHRHLN